MREINLISEGHKGTQRDYLERMINNKVHCMDIASLFDKDYWDGDRKYGYGGYIYNGRWKKVAEDLIKLYNLDSDSCILDLGCGKGHLLYELKKILNCKVVGLDISKYAIESGLSEVKESLKCFDIREALPFPDNYFDLCISVMTIHNFEVFEVEKILKEITRCSQNSYLAVESYRNHRELFNLQCWALTCKSFLTPQGWEWLFEKAGYDRDVEFAFFT